MYLGAKLGVRRVYVLAVQIELHLAIIPRHEKVKPIRGRMRNRRHLEYELLAQYAAKGHV